MKIFVCRECGRPISDDGLCSPLCKNDADLVWQRPYGSVAVLIYKLWEERPYDPAQDGAPAPAAEEPKR